MLVTIATVIIALQLQVAPQSDAQSPADAQPVPTKPAKKETPAVDQIIRANVNRETAPGPDFVSLYANDTQVQISPWDFRIIFGLITEMPSVASPSVSVKLIGEARMSPQRAHPPSLRPHNVCSPGDGQD